jgi:ubiquinone/menaquinone biosynthesis C-methylase UbiE
VNVETGRPRSAPVHAAFRAFVSVMTALVGTFSPENKAAYAFLAGSIASFHSPEELSEIILKAGFVNVRHETFMLGAVAVHTGVRS